MAPSAYVTVSVFVENRCCNKLSKPPVAFSCALVSSARGSTASVAKLPRTSSAV